MKSAIEFYSGIGSFAEATRDSDVEVTAAFDQSREANSVYQHNFALKPRLRNLDGIDARNIPKADIWWLSPPCKPFTVRGKRKDDTDSRARSILNLIDLIPQAMPETIILENVLGFAGSNVHGKLKSTLLSASYNLSEVQICPTLFGIPMKRPRHFVVGSKTIARIDRPRAVAIQPVSHYLMPSLDPELVVNNKIIERYGESLNFVDEYSTEDILICVTSNYWKSMKASGSLIKTRQGKVRRLSPDEIVRLLGFSFSFRFPASIDLRTRWRLSGAAVDVSSIRHLLGQLKLLHYRADNTGVELFRKPSFI